MTDVDEIEVKREILTFGIFIEYRNDHSAVNEHHCFVEVCGNHICVPFIVVLDYFPLFTRNDARHGSRIWVRFSTGRGYASQKLIVRNHVPV